MTAGSDRKRVGVIGAGMVGVCAASWLQRDGHRVFLVAAGAPGHGTALPMLPPGTVPRPCVPAQE